MAQKTRTHTLKSRHTQNECEILVQSHDWKIFLRKLVAVTVNGDRYRDMLNELLFTKIEEDDIGNN